MANTKLPFVCVLFILLINFAHSQRRGHHGNPHGRPHEPRGNAHGHRQHLNQHPGAFAVMLLNGKGPSIGVVRIEIMKDGVHLRSHLHDLTPGGHGFHIHANSSLRENCKGAGGHYNPKQKKHGGPYDTERHVGDLGNIFADESGMARINIVDSHLSLTGPESIIGRVIVIHAQEDDLGRGQNEDSLLTGNAGGRIACGVIESDQSSSRLTHEKLQF